jgi:hypothetical protein
MQEKRFIALTLFASAQSQLLQPRSNANFWLYAYGPGIGGGAVVFLNSMHFIFETLNRIITNQCYPNADMAYIDYKTSVSAAVSNATCEDLLFRKILSRLHD